MWRRAEDGGYTITDPQRGHTRHFAPAGAVRSKALPLSAITDRVGQRIDLDYAADGTLTEVRHSGGYRIGVQTAGGRITALHLLGVAAGVLVRYGYDERGRLTEVTNSSGVPLRFYYDDVGRLTGWQDRNGVAYRYTYDDVGRCVRTSGSGGCMDATFAYDPRTRVTVFTDSLGYATTCHLNELGQVVREVDPLDGSTVSVWDRYDRLLARTNPLGRTTGYAYDGAGNLVTLTRADGSRALAEYNELHLPVTVTTPDGASWRRAYDERGNLTALTDPLGATTSYAYDEQGQLAAVTDALGHLRRVQTNAAGLPTAVTDPVGGVTRFGWTTEGKLAWRTLPDGATEHWSYDGEGNLVEHRDALGQLTRTEIGPFDLSAAQIGPDGARLEFGYDTELRLVNVTNPQGLRWRYDYDPAGREIERHLGTGAVLAQSWDTNHRLAAQTLTAAGPGPSASARLVQHRSYRYRPDGYVTTIEDHLAGLRRFDLDRAGRVTAVHGAGWSERYAYDPAGNITAASWPAPPQADCLDADACGEREYAGTLIRRAGTVRYQHDAQGRVTLRQQKRLSAKPRTWHYTWDADDLLTGVTTPDGARWRYRYDPLGRRITKQRLRADGVSVAEQVDFTWDGTVLAEQTHTTGPDELARTTVWDWEPDTFRPVSQTERTPLRDAPQKWVDEQFYAIVTDLVGTPTEVLSPDGTLAWQSHATLWGNTPKPTLGELDCPLRFPGQYHDPETSLHYNYHRYYDPAVARYTRSDPLGLAAGLLPHSYVHNPVSWIDPLGLTESGHTEWVDSNLINFSQRTISENDYAELMRSGRWDWERPGSALRVIEVNGRLVTYDNRRLDAARELGASVPVQRVNPNDSHPDSITGKTWGDKFRERFNDPRNRREGGPVPNDGLSERPRMKCKE